MPHSQKNQNIKQKQYCNKFNKDFKKLVHIKKKILKKKKEGERGTETERDAHAQRAEIKMGNAKADTGEWGAERLKETESWDFPGGPVGKTPRSQCRGPRFDPWSGN